jgi:hypothetical protein
MMGLAATEETWTNKSDGRVAHLALIATDWARYRRAAPKSIGKGYSSILVIADDPRLTEREKSSGFEATSGSDPFAFQSHSNFLMLLGLPIDQVKAEAPSQPPLPAVVVAPPGRS